MVSFGSQVSNWLFNKSQIYQKDDQMTKTLNDWFLSRG